MKLAEWRKSEELTQQQVAEALDCGFPSVFRYEAGTRLPERDTMRAIYVLTRGAVQPNDFYDIPSWEAEAIKAEAEAEMARAA